jgi:ribosomal protein L37AE/L43A
MRNSVRCDSCHNISSDLYRSNNNVWLCYTCRIREINSRLIAGLNANKKEKEEKRKDPYNAQFQDEFYTDFFGLKEEDAEELK